MNVLTTNERLFCIMTLDSVLPLEVDRTVLAEDVLSAIESLKGTPEAFIILNYIQKTLKDTA